MANNAKVEAALRALLPLIPLLLIGCSAQPAPDLITPASTVAAIPSATQTSTTVRPTSAPTETLSPVEPLRLAYRGVDASYLPEIEDSGGLFYDGGAPADALQIFRDHGVNLIRLRLWNDPLGGYNNLDHVLAMARRVQALGMGILLDFHFSDGWADPGKQNKPGAWANLPFDQLERALQEYTRLALAAFREQGTLPEMVQVGNEITSGILWAEGRVGGSWDSNWPRLATLLKAGIRGAEVGAGGAGRVKILLHVDAGGNNATCRWYFDHIEEAGVPYDAIALSYYPWWHGGLADLEANLADLAARYEKPILIAETAYPWTLKNADRTGNLVVSELELLPGFPATPEGQRAFLFREGRLLENLPAGRGWGFVYWAADDISTPRLESNWDNLTLFDFAGNALLSLDIFLPAT